MTNEELIALWKKTGDENYLAKLIDQNMGLVMRQARKFGWNSLEDASQDGIEALILAANRYEESKGKFTTYANFWIIKQINEGRPGGTDWVSIKIRMLRDNNPNVSMDDLYDMVKKTQKNHLSKHKFFTALNQSLLSLDMRHPERDISSLEDHMNLQSVQNHDLLELDAILSKISDPDIKRVVNGLREGYNVKEIALLEGMSRQNIYQMLRKVIPNLKVKQVLGNKNSVKITEYQKQYYQKNKKSILKKQKERKCK